LSSNTNEVISKYIGSNVTTISIEGDQNKLIVNDIRAASPTKELIETYNDLRIDISVTSKIYLEDSIIRILIRDRNNSIILIANNRLTNQKLKLEIGENKLSCVIRNIPFISGNYTFAIEFIDFNLKAHSSFSVQNFINSEMEPNDKSGILLQYEWVNED